MDLYMSSLGTLVPKGPWCVFYVTKHHVYWGLTHNVIFYWYSDLIWNKKTHSTLRGQSTDTPIYIYIYTTCYRLTAANLTRLNEYFTNIKNLLSTMSSLFKNCSLAKVIYMLIRCCKTRFFLWTTNNTDRNDVNKQSTHTSNTQRKITMERVS